jgi:hypothetical protein
MLKPEYLKNKTKSEFRNTILKRVLTKGDQQKLRVFERVLLRNIYGSTRENEGWRIKYNYELYDLQYNALEIVKTLKLRRLR